MRGGSLTPSFKWAVLHNWLYFFSLGLSSVNLPRIISTIVNDDRSPAPTPKSIRVSGDVEALDKALTFMGVGFLGALSDVTGRKPLMAWSALGYGITCLLQASTRRSVASLFLADFVDGISSCMSTVAQAYVADVSPPERRAINLGMFQGISIGGAFIFAFPLAGVLGAKLGPRKVVMLAAAVQLLNFVLIAFVTPESCPAYVRAGRRLNLAEANPLGALNKLFGSTSLLRHAAIAYFFISLGRTVLDAQYSNYALYRFRMGPQQSGPLLVLVGLMLAVAPQLVVPRLGLSRSILYGTLVFVVGQVLIGFAPSPSTFVGAILVTSVGCAAIPAVVAFIANQAAAGEEGALLGGLSSLTELCGALGLPTYSRLFAFFISDAAPFHLPGAHFLLAAVYGLVSFAASRRNFARNANEAAKFLTQGATKGAKPAEPEGNEEVVAVE